MRYSFIKGSKPNPFLKGAYPLAINDVNNGGYAAGHGAVVDHHNPADLDESSERLWRRKGRKTEVRAIVQEGELITRAAALELQLRDRPASEKPTHHIDQRLEESSE